MRVKEALEEFYLSMDGIVSPATVKWYHHKMSSFDKEFGDSELEDMTIQMLRSWRGKLARRNERFKDHPTKPTLEGKMSGYTLHAHVRACRRFFKWLEEENILTDNPARKLELPPKPKNCRRGIKDKDRDLIIEEAKKYPRDYAIVIFLADTACRVGGLAGLRLNEIDFEQNVAVVHEKGKGGNQKARMVFFGEKTKRALEEWLEIRPKDSKYTNVFLNYHNGKPLKEGGFYQVLARLARDAGVENGYNPHNWRHGAARGMIKNGASLIEVCQILGHSTVQVTGDFYGVISEEELKEAHNKHSWLQ